MKKILFMLFAAAAFVACDDDVTREPSPVTVEDCQNVYFPNSNEASAIYAPTDTEFSVTVTREVTDEAAEVPVKVECVAAECFVFPETVVFEAGAATAEYVIGLTDKMEYFKEYSFQLTIGEEYADYYTVNDNGSAVMVMTVAKSDWTVVGTGAMNCSLFGPSWYPQTIEYSELLGQYRFPGLYASGYDINFTWDGGATANLLGSQTYAYSGMDLWVYYCGDYAEGVAMFMMTVPTAKYDAANSVFSLTSVWYVNGYGPQSVFTTYVQITDWLN